MARSSAVFEAISFKPVRDGFVFRAPNPWIVGRARHYLVNEAQKAGIVERVAQRGRFSLLVAFLVWLASIAAATGALALLTGHDDPTLGDTLVLVVVAPVSLIVCLQVRYMLLLRPLIANLPESRERITFRERRMAVRKAPRAGSLTLAGALFSVACASSFYSFFLRTHGGHLGLDDGPAVAQLFAAMVTGLVAVRFFYLDIASGKPGAEESTEASRSETDRLASRLDRVEEENGRLRRTLACVVALIAAVAVGTVVFLGAISGLTRAATANSFILHNSKGEPAAYLGVGKDDAPTLALLDREHKLRMTLGLSANGAPSIGLYGSQQETRLTVGLASDGSPTLGLYGSKRELRMTMALAPDGSPALHLNGADGKPRLVLTVNPDIPGILLSDSHEALRLRLAIDDTGVPIRIFDAASVPIRAFDAAGKEVPAQR